MADARQFRLELDRWLTETVPAEVAATQRRMAAEALTQIVQATPVGNPTKWKGNIERATRGLAPLPKGYVGGQARRNWQVGVGISPAGVLAGTDPSGNAALSEGFANIARLSAPGRIYITNRLDYMDALESGWSKQAPRGMVAQAVANVSAKYARVR